MDGKTLISKIQKMLDENYTHEEIIEYFLENTDDKKDNN